MAIAFDNTGTATGNSATSLTIDITAATVAAWCYAFIMVGVSNPLGFTMTGWQQLCDIQEGTNSHFGLYRRVKQAGDTTFAATWANAQGASAAWSSYTGLLAACPEEGFRSATHTSASTSYTTANVTPADGTRWALCGVGARSTTVSGETWTAPGTQTIRSQATNTATTWTSAAIADSNGAVTQASHNYSFTLSASESHGGAVICLLVPATSGTPIYPPPVNKNQGVKRAANW